MKRLFISLILPLALVIIAYPSYADDDRDYLPAGNPFKKLIMMVEALDERVTELEEENAELKSNLACVSSESDAYDVYFEGCNVHVRNGTGSTESKNDRGNLIVGYNEDTLGGTNDRTGSHNLVVGPEHTYSSYAGFVTGRENTVSGIFTSVSGGVRNTASGNWSSISGGDNNITSGNTSSISGGSSNQATNTYGTISGGQLNVASGFRSHVSGGRGNAATAENSVVSGGNGVNCSATYGWAAGTTADTCP